MINCWKSLVLRYGYLSVIFLSPFFFAESRAQNSVGIGTTEPNPNAVLELQSDHQGFLVPSLTTVQREQMRSVLSGSSQNNGLIVFDKNTGKFYYWFDGEWVTGLGSFSGPAAGDLSGNFPSPRVVALQGNPVSAGTPGNSQILQWDGNVWKPVDNYTAGSGITISGNQVINTGDTDPDDDLLKTDPAGGDVSGTFDDLQLLPGSVGSGEISDESITTGKIKDRAVSLQKINTGPNDAILVTDGKGIPVWEDQGSFANDKTNQQGVLLGDGSDMLGVQGTLTNQLLKWNAVTSTWQLAQDNDGQQLSLKDDVLELENGGIPIDLSGYLDNTDSQDLSNVLNQNNDAGALSIKNLADPTAAQDAATKSYVDGLHTADGDRDAGNEIQDLSLSGNTLSLSGDASEVDLGKYLDNTDSQKLDNVLSHGNDAGAVAIKNLADPAAAQDAATKNYVDGLHAADGDRDAANEIQDLDNVLSQGNDAGGLAIINLNDPSDPKDAATKGYVDAIDTDDADADPDNEIQDLSLSGNTLSLSSDGTTVDLSGYLDNTDNQQLTLTGELLELENGGTPIDLSPYKDNTDSQDLSGVLGEGNDGGGLLIRNLADPLMAQDAATKTYVDELHADDGDMDPANEIQDLSLSGNTLSLSSDGTTVDLSAYLDNTDDQQLSLVGDELSIEDGNTVDLSAYKDNTDSQNLSGVLGEGNDAGALVIENLADPLAAQDAATKSYVDGLHAADGDKSATNELISSVILKDSGLEITEGGVTTIVPKVGDIASVYTFNGSGISGGTSEGTANLRLVNSGKGEILIGDSANIFSRSISGVISLDSDGVTTLQNNVVSTSHIIDSSITSNKLAQSGATSGQVLVWDGTVWAPSDAAAINGSGDITGVQAGTGLTGGGVSGSVALSLENTGNGEILIGDGSNVNSVSLGGDILLSSAGTAKINDNAVTTPKLANGSVTDAKILSMAYSKLSGVANTNDILQWDGSQWKAVALATGVTATVSKYQSIGPVSFGRTGDGLKSDMSYPGEGAYAVMASGGTGVAIAPLFLPDRAQIEEVTVYLYDNITENISASLQIKPLNGAAGTKILLGSTGGASTATQEVSGSLAETVDNSQFIYRIIVEAKPDDEHRIFGARIKFTETVVDAAEANGSRMGGKLNVSPSAPSSPQPGMLWLDSDNEVIYEWDGNSWEVRLYDGLL